MLMNSGGGEEARLHYGDGEFTVMRPGAFVRCAVSRAAIALADLKYWSVDRQEAYASAAIAFERSRQAPSAAGKP